MSSIKPIKRALISVSDTISEATNYLYIFSRYAMRQYYRCFACTHEGMCMRASLFVLDMFHYKCILRSNVNRVVME